MDKIDKIDKSDNEIDSKRDDEEFLKMEEDFKNVKGGAGDIIQVGGLTTRIQLINKSIEKLKIYKQDYEKKETPEKLEYYEAKKARLKRTLKILEESELNFIITPYLNGKGIDSLNMNQCNELIDILIKFLQISFFNLLSLALINGIPGLYIHLIFLSSTTSPMTLL